MMLLTPELRERPLANARDRDADHVPIARFFNPIGAATWLATELDEDGDTLFGLADLGFGYPELGSFSLSELQAAHLAFGLGIERDLHFMSDLPISAFAEAARAVGSIPGGERVLRAGASRQLRAAPCAKTGEEEG